MRSLNFALTWYVTSITTLAFSALLLAHISLAPTLPVQTIQSTYHLYKALPGEISDQEVSITKADSRAILVANLFKDNNAPLAAAAAKFIESADKYGIDWKLLPAIAMQESNGGKVVPNNSFNPFGYGVYGGQTIRYSSWEEAIDKVAQGLKKNYIDIGLKTPYQIMTKYTPPSLTKGGPWAIGVSTFMAQLQ